MTTPERLRRRQRIEGVVLILLAIFTALQAVYFSIQNQDQNDCVADQFSRANYALIIRAHAAEKETNATNQVLAVYARAAGYLKKNPNKPLPTAQQKKLQQQAVDALLNYDKQIKEVQRQRAAHPVPPFPQGRCQ